MNYIELIGKIMQWAIIIGCLLIIILFTIITIMGNCSIWCWLLLIPFLLFGARIAKVEE